MEKITVKELLDWTGGSLKQGRKDFVIRSISIDSRSLKRGDFFIPIAGENFDGHIFISAAVAQGASGSLFASGKFNPPSLAPPARGGEFLPLDGGGKVGVRIFSASKQRTGGTFSNGRNHKVMSVKVLSGNRDEKIPAFKTAAIN